MIEAGFFLHEDNVNEHFQKSEVRNKLSNVSLAAEVADEELEAFGYFKVYEDDAPAYDQETQSLQTVAPVKIAGKYVRRMVVVDKPPSEIRAMYDTRRETKLDLGMPWSFQGQDQHVQIRDRDMIFLIRTSTRAKELIAAGVTDAVIPFRTKEDNNFMLTPDEALAMTDAADQHIADIWAECWTAKDTLAASL